MSSAEQTSLAAGSSRVGEPCLAHAEEPCLAQTGEFCPAHVEENDVAQSRQEDCVTAGDLIFYNSKGKVVPAPVMPCGIADTHTHLGMLEQPALALARCAGVHLDFITTVTDPAEPDATYDQLDAWRDAARKQLDAWGEVGLTALDGRAFSTVPVPHVRILVGVHPHNAKDYTHELETHLRQRAADLRTCGIGEIGLDYHYDFSPRETQREVFARQIELAHELDLPVALHLREAHDEGLTILRREGVPQAGCVLHCFNLDLAVLQPFLELGCYIAFGGPLTFRKSHDTRAAALHVPVDRLLTETDAPYMTPEPLRGTTCSPEHTIFTAELLGSIYGEAHPAYAQKAEFFRQVFDNALRVFDQPRERGKTHE